MRSTEHAKSPLTAVGTSTQNNLDKFEFGGTALSLAAEAWVVSAQCMHETVRAQGWAFRVAHRTQVAMPSPFCCLFGAPR
eukprot:7382206-Prymnesium_polylepis.1